MLSLLTCLKSAEFEYKAFALTSHDRACFLSQDDYATPWWVIVTPMENEYYKIECRIPREFRPWSSATLISEESSAEKACETVMAGLRYSRGWDTTVGGEPIGLAELLDEELYCFRIAAAREACRSCEVDWYNTVRKSEGEEIPVTVLFEIGDREMIGYRYDSPCETRWGLLCKNGDDKDQWFWGLDDAFFRSRAWPDGPPNDEYTYFWNRRNGLR